MIEFQEIELSNFWSFGKKPTVVDLSDGKSELIIGDNRDTGDTGNSRNGVGKSGLYQGIIYALFGKGTENVKQDEFVNLVNEKKMRVKLTFKINDRQCEVIRTRKPNNVEFYIDGESYTRDSMANTDSEIQKTIGMNHTIFINTMYLSPDITPFMAMKPAEQRNFIEEILSLDTLAKRAETLKQLKKENDVEVRIEQQSIEKDEQSNEQLRKQQEQAEVKLKKWYEDVENDINNLHKELDDLKSVDFKYYSKLNEEIDSIERKIELKQSDLKWIEQSLNEQKTNLKNLKSEKSNLENLIEQYDTFDDSKSKRIKKLEDKRKELSEIDFEYYFSVIETIDSIKKNMDDISNDIERKRKKIKELNNELEKLWAEASHLDSGECPYCHQKYNSEEKIQSITDNINDVHTNRDEQNKVLSTLEEDYYELKHDLDRHVEILGNHTYESLLNSKNELKSIDEKINDEKNSTNPYEKMLNDDLEKYDDDPFEYFENWENEYKEKIDKYEFEYDQEQEAIKALQKDLEDKKSETVTQKYLDQLEKNMEDVQRQIAEYKRKENPYKNTIESLKESYKTIDTSKLDHLKNKSEHYSLLVKMLTDNKSFIRKNIVDEYIPFINSKINYYLDKVDSPHFVELNSDMTVNIQYMNRDVSYGSTSKGERLRLNLATCLAFRDLIGVLGKRSNLMLIDEVFDVGLDRNGFLNVFNLIKDYADKVMIISHRDELIDQVDKVTTVVKQNGFSRIEYK